MYASEIGEAVIINCDENYVQNPFKDINEFPSDILKNLKNHLTGSPADLCGNQIPKLFFRSLVQIIGAYRNAIKNNDGQLMFVKKLFIKRHSRRNRRFAGKIVELQMFQQFLDDRLKTSTPFSDEFENEVNLFFKRKRRGIFF